MFTKSICTRFIIILYRWRWRTRSGTLASKGYSSDRRARARPPAVLCVCVCMCVCISLYKCVCAHTTSVWMGGTRPFCPSSYALARTQTPRDVYAHRNHDLKPAYTHCSYVKACFYMWKKKHYREHITILLTPNVLLNEYFVLLPITLDKWLLIFSHSRPLSISMSTPLQNMCCIYIYICYMNDSWYDKIGNLIMYYSLIIRIIPV